MMSACGCPDPSTGMRFPRGQCGHAWRSRVKAFSSRIARSRYFSRISSSVTGMPPEGSDGPSGCPWACISSCPRTWPCDDLTSAAPAPFGRAAHAADAPCAARTLRRGGTRASLQELEGLHVQKRRGTGDDLGAAERVHELGGAVEVAHANARGAEALGDVRVGTGAGGDAVLGGEPLGLVVEGVDRDARVEDLDDVDLVDDGKQVLVVGHRVHAVEGVRHV